MSSNAKLVVPVVLGLSLVSVTAFVVYYVFKKDEDEKKENGIKTSRINVIEIKVPKRIVPALIGRSGSNIKEIERKSGALINFKKLTEAEHDVCIVRGRSQAAQLAETIVLDFIRQQPELREDAMSVPQWACGRIIGTGGENITDISHRSGARVKVEGLSTDKSSERIITIRGSTEQIKQARDLIENCVAREKCRREIEQSKSPRLASPAPAAAAAPAPADQSESSAPSIEVYVSAVSSPSRFWVQFVGAQVTQLDELVQEMTEYYGDRGNREQHTLSSVHIGQVVAAVFRHDGRWYRARVHDLRPNEFDATQQVADVFYLDYGDSEYVATHELCELRGDLLRLRFQAMECFLAGVRPAGAEPEGAAPRWDKWPAPAVERFEELTQVARWKPLVSRTCTYKKIPTDGEKEKEIPGIKLFDVTEEGELDIGAVLISEGWAAPGAGAGAPLPHAPPFGDLGNSRVLGMLSGARASSLPKDHKDDRVEQSGRNEHEYTKDPEGMTSSKSLASGLEHSENVLSVSNFDLTYPENQEPHTNGSHDNFLNAERLNLESESSASTETLTPASPLSKIQREEIKANMNRIDSHHSNLEALGRTTHELNL